MDAGGDVLRGASKMTVIKGNFQKKKKRKLFIFLEQQLTT